MKSNEEKIIGIDLSFISGMMVGIELFDDEVFNYVILDLFILRFTYFREKSS